MTRGICVCVCVCVCCIAGGRAGSALFGGGPADGGGGGGGGGEVGVTSVGEAGETRSGITSGASCGRGGRIGYGGGGGGGGGGGRERSETVSLRRDEREMDCPPAVLMVDFVDGARVDALPRLPRSWK